MKKHYILLLVASLSINSLFAMESAKGKEPEASPFGQRAPIAAEVILNTISQDNLFPYFLALTEAIQANNTTMVKNIIDTIGTTFIFPYANRSEVAIKARLGEIIQKVFELFNPMYSKIETYIGNITPGEYQASVEKQNIVRDVILFLTAIADIDIYNIYSARVQNFLNNIRSIFPPKMKVTVKRPGLIELDGILLTGDSIKLFEVLTDQKWQQLINESPIDYNTQIIDKLLSELDRMLSTGDNERLVNVLNNNDWQKVIAQSSTDYNNQIINTLINTITLAQLEKINDQVIKRKISVKILDKLPLQEGVQEGVRKELFLQHNLKDLLKDKKYLNNVLIDAYQKKSKKYVNEILRLLPSQSDWSSSSMHENFIDVQTAKEL